MPKPHFPPKPAAPSVRETIAQGIERSRGLSRGERTLTKEEVVKDILAKLDLPPSIRKDLKRRHGLE